MNTLYLDCRMGASGAKIMGALVDLLDNPDKFIYDFNRIGIDGVSVRRVPEAIKGISGSQLEFCRTASTKEDPYADEVDDNEPIEKIRIRRVHRNLAMVFDMISGTNVSDTVKERAKKIYQHIADETSRVYGKNVNEMVLHRTGSRDIIASVVGVCMLLEMLAPEDIVVSTVAVGSGYIKTPRGTVPVPSAELQNILKNIPYVNGEEETEVCSLEGAAILATIADRSGTMPELVRIKKGAGFGMRNYKSGVNCVCAYIGENVALASDILVQLNTQIFRTNDEEIIVLKKRLEAIGCGDVATSIITDSDGNFGYALRCIIEDERANVAATEILSNSNAERVYRINCSVYKN